MTQYQITTSKGFNGWAAKTQYVLGETLDGTRVLELTTMKAKGGASSSAIVYYLKGEGDYQTKTTALFHDFAKYNIAQSPIKRVTEKSITEAHKIALLQMDELIEEATNFYEKLDNES